MRTEKEIIEQLTKITGKISGGNSGTKATYTSMDYSNALEYLKDKNTTNPFFILMPGVTDKNIQKLAMDVSDIRGNDCQVKLDAENTINEDDIINNVATIDNAWGECLAGWVYMNDMYKNREVQVPPTVLYGRSLVDAQNKQEYGSAAGENRGILKSALGVVYDYTEGAKIKMQAGRINPVILLDGRIMVYNNMTLIRKESVYSDVNTVNVNCALKKSVLATTRGFVFENNNPRTWNRWKTTVDPILKNVQDNEGVYSYQILMGEKDGTLGATEIDSGYMPGIIKFKPQREAKWIPITFNAYSYGVDFKDEI